MLRSQDAASLQRYVRHLRGAVYTTACRTTRDALQQMLNEAEAALARLRPISAKEGIEAEVAAADIAMKDMD